jgi:hypothetical protein
MALSEFVAMEAAYRALQPLDSPARVRALQWLTDALGVPGILPGTPADNASGGMAGGTESVSAPAVQATTSSRGGRAGRSRSATTGGSPRAARGRGLVVDAGNDGRVYRRMPPVDDVLAAYQQVGTISGLAEYYHVPRHTVQGWARRLRREGYNIGRGAA